MCKVAPCTQLLRGRAGLGPRGVCTPWSSAASSSVFSERDACQARRAWAFCHFPHLPRGDHGAGLVGTCEDWAEPAMQ